MDYLAENTSTGLFDSRLHLRNLPYGSGVWRFRELVHPLVSDEDIVSRPEGNTSLYRHKKISAYTGLEDIFLKHEGENRRAHSKTGV